MTSPTTRLHLEVAMLADQGSWWPGVLNHWRERNGRREAWVRYSTGVGETRLGWFDAADVPQSNTASVE